MLLPQLSGGANSRQFVQNFGGMNHNKRGNTGELYDVMNMTCDNYPILSTRKKRAVGNLNGVKNVSGMQTINGAIYYIGMKTIENTNTDESDEEPTYTYEYHLYKNNEEVDGYTFSEGDKRTVVMGANIIIFPDKVKYNTVENTFESLVAVFNKRYEMRIVDSLYKDLPEYWEVDGKNTLRNNVLLGIAVNEEEYKILKNPNKNNTGQDNLINEVNELINKYFYQKSGMVRENFYFYSPDNNELYSVAIQHDDNYTKYEFGVKTNGHYQFGAEITSTALHEINYIMDLRGNEIYFAVKKKDNTVIYGKDTPYVKITGPDIASIFDSRDIIKIEEGETSGTKKIYTPNDTVVVYSTDADGSYIIVQGFLNVIRIIDTAEKQIKITREVPDMDLIVGHHNRLYGCKFNAVKDNKNEAINEIYISKLGSPGNFTVATGSDDTGYVMSVGENGEFTGAISYNGNVYFFKERCAIGINSYFNSTVLPIPGISKESENSLTICAGYLVYLGANGVYAFNGETSVNISEAFGDTSYRFATFGETLGNKYYLCAVENEKYEAERLNAAEEAKRMREQKVSEELEKQGLKPTSPLYNVVKRIYDLLFKVAFIIESNIKVLNDSKAGVMLVYDFNKSTWMKEEQQSLIRTGVSDGRHIYYCDYDNKVYRISDNDTFNVTPGFSFKEEPDFKWYAESEELGYSYPDSKHILKINLRVRVPVGSEMRITMEYDSDGREVNLYGLRDVGHKSVNCYIIPHRCDHLKIRVSGKGECDIISAAVVFYQGSDR